MDAPRVRKRTPRERYAPRLQRLKRRVAGGAILGFGAVVGLSARHSLGAPSHPRPVHARRVTASRPATAATFFDQHDAGAYTFEDAARATAAPPAQPPAPPPVLQPPPPPPPPPVAESSVS